jgi:exodeoxyribonuclease VII large subunit
LFPVSFTIEALNQQIRSTVVRVLYDSFYDRQRQVVVRGTIGEISAGPYRMAYRLPLRDGDQTVYLDFERELLSRNRIEQGDYVEVTGVLTVDEGQSQSSRIDIRVAVSRIEHVNRPQEVDRNERAILEYLKNLKPALSQLPEIGSIVISLIHPVSERARVQDDFQQQLGPVKYLVQMAAIPVAMNKPEEIANGVRRAKGNVIVLIRGGGDPADFDVFDQKSVIEAWAGKNAYKVLGLGHEGTGSTLLHFISDYSASTPSAVGTFLGVVTK